jgi:hypothetical protein
MGMNSVAKYLRHSLLGVNDLRSAAGRPNGYAGREDENRGRRLGIGDRALRSEETVAADTQQAAGDDSPDARRPTRPPTGAWTDTSTTLAAPVMAV